MYPRDILYKIRSVKLTAREIQVLDLLMQGCSNKEIAAILCIKTRTVKCFMHNLFLKFNINDGIKRVKLVYLYNAWVRYKEGEGRV